MIAGVRDSSQGLYEITFTSTKKDLTAWEAHMKRLHKQRKALEAEERKTVEMGISELRESETLKRQFIIALEV